MARGDRFIETLEQRQFLSGDVLGSAPGDVLAGPAPSAAPPALAAAPARPLAVGASLSAQDLLGTWRGIGDTYGEQLGLTLRVTYQSGNRFVGRIFSWQDPEFHLRLGGTLNADLTFRATVTGGNGDGPLDGVIRGYVKVDGSRIGGTATMTQDGDTFRSSIYLTKRS